MTKGEMVYEGETMKQLYINGDHNTEKCELFNENK